MKITLRPGILSGSIAAPPSKSMAHRYLICAAFADKPVAVYCPDPNEDINATADCLRALGCGIQATENGFRVTPVVQAPPNAVLNCGESGSTLRFLLPIVGALGVDATFQMAGRLSHRPLSPLWEEMERMGCHLCRPTADTIRCTGKLRPGKYRMDGRVSSQFISSLLMALPLLGENCDLQIIGQPASAPYVDMTKAAIQTFRPCAPAEIRVEGDWSSAAFWLAANALGSHITVSGLREASLQGDRAITGLLPMLREYCSISAMDVPDLVPILAVVAAVNRGAVFTDIQRLRLKESDRVTATVAMIRALGSSAEATETTLTVCGTGLTGGTVDSFRDHRIAMSAAIAATACKESVTVLDAQCVAKSYPNFWDDYALLGGKYEKPFR